MKTLIITDSEVVESKGKVFFAPPNGSSFYALERSYVGETRVLLYKTSGMKYCGKEVFFEEFTSVDGVDFVIYDKPQSILDMSKRIKKEVQVCDCLAIRMPTLYGIVAAHYARKYKKRYLVECVGDAFGSLWDHGGFIHKLCAIPNHIANKHYISKASAVRYVSQFYLQRKYKTGSINVGCALVVMDPPMDCVLEARLTKIENSGPRFIVGLIGETQVEYRGHDTLIDAVSILVEKGYDIEIRFLSGGRGDSLRIAHAKEKGIADRVFFDGKKAHSEVNKWIDGIDILAMPTLQETFGRSVVEAMSRGCPVIGTIETALREILGADCLISARDSVALAKKIEGMISCKKYMKLLAQENFYKSQKFALDFTLPVMKKIYDDFHNLIDSTSKY